MRPASFRAPAPVVQHIRQRLLDRVPRRPAGGGAELGGVGHEQGLVHRADAGRVDADLDRDAGQGREDLEGVREPGAPAGAEVVDLARRRPFGQEAVGADDVADVGEVADDVEVADLDARPGPGLDLGDLPGQAAEHVAGRLPGAGVVERAGHHDVGAVGEEVLDAQQVGRPLAGGVRVVRPERAGLAHRQVLGRRVAVADARADDHHPRRPAPSP